MRLHTTLSLVTIAVLGLTITSCKKEGCMDDTANNYDSEAKKDDGSCMYEEEEDSYTIPTTYAFEDGSVSTVSFSGQQQRLEMLSELVTEMKTGNTLGTTVSAATLKLMYENDPSYMWADATSLEMTGSSKQLRSKTAGGDVTIQALFESYIDSLNVISALAYDNSAQDYGQGGVWTNGTKTYLQSGTGIEYTQIIEKGLMAAVFMHQMTNNYLNTLDDDNNTDLVTGKTYTEMQHHWDEAYGYFTSEFDYPINGTDRFWGKYANSREDVLGSATTIATAFRTGRAAIDNDDYTTRDEQIVIIKDAMEQVCAGTAIHYLNAALGNLSDATLLNHELSEAWAFIDGLRYSDNTISGAGISTTDIDAALALIGTNFEEVTIANLNAAIDLIAAGTGLESVKADL
ncbi:MAG: DUF4856 domain-containing protein [Flavobacteriales bacterium]|nr:DUF4856 domain-containing protein [Flavobacteriales bacterium]